MAKHWEVISYLRPEGGIIAIGQEFEGIDFVWADPFTKEEYLAAFDAVDAANEAAALAKEANKQVILDKLGITAEEAALLLK